jgi:hypothetical protein
MIKGMVAIYRMAKKNLYIAWMRILKFDQNLTFSEIIHIVDQSPWMQRSQTMEFNISSK